MENEVMRAFLNGFAALVTAFFREVAKHGLSIMLLTIISVSLLLRGERMEALEFADRVRKGKLKR